METINARKYSEQLYGELAKIGKCLSSSRRLELLELLTQCEKTVENLAHETQMSIANTSKHLQVLYGANLVRRRKNGNFVVYSLASKNVATLADSLKTVGEERLAEIKELQADLFQAELTLTKAKALQANKNALFLDVRPQDEYQAGHIQGALNIPIAQLEEHFAVLPNDQVIIVYCRGKMCSYAKVATKLLKKKGYKAYSLDYSYYDWVTDKK